MTSSDACAITTMRTVLGGILTVLLAACGQDPAAAPAGSPAGPRPHVVLYCATDREIAQDLIDQFEHDTGIQVDAKFDTEAAKAVGLVQAIRQEKANPQCDVLWGGGAFFCTLLAHDGCLAAAPPDLIAAQGAAPHDAAGHWLGFAAAYRVLIVNTDVLPPESRPQSFRDLADPRFKGHIGIANPLFGGMAAHAAALFALLGEQAGRRWCADLKRNECALCAGMADVKNRVASGELWFGITSTIDAHVAVDGGKPVTIIFPDQGPDGIGCLNGYNAVALIAGAPHPREAEQLMRFLMTTRTERILAAGPGQNVGMLPESVAADVRPAWIPRVVKTMPVDWDAAVAAHPAATAAINDVLLHP
jgi:iron(III) transport system substrate-binding protein